MRLQAPMLAALAVARPPPQPRPQHLPLLLQHQVPSLQQLLRPPL